ncbi:uncharacterized protein LOC128964573 [Oppia nitens]|uniref:uncharacterized protein LOC128964573 n=1 Tax=Oppia nitens TaxID=1686743 RepID=UPI0023D9C4DD|nr:uncharacterized protein LOC128964573 [Oppia nitens]
MIGHYLSRLTILFFGTLFPAYSSYKAVKNRDIKEYSRWMMYWIVFAIFSFIEVFSDIFIGFWLPFYYELKIVFILWLMSPYGNGSKILYLHLVHPQLTTHEQTIDLYIDSAKRMGITSVWNLWTKVTEFANRSLIYFFQIAQTIVINQIQRTNTSAVDGPAIHSVQTQQLLSQSNFLPQFLFMRSPTTKPIETQSANNSPQSDNTSSHESMALKSNAMSQRWFSAEALHLFDINEDIKPVPNLMSLRMRSESESNLDDWEQMDITEVDGKPPVQPSKGRKKAKTPKNTTNTEKPVRRTTRVAAVKARAKCKQDNNLPEDIEEFV